MCFCCIGLFHNFFVRHLPHGREDYTSVVRTTRNRTGIALILLCINTSSLPVFFNRFVCQETRRGEPSKITGEHEWFHALLHRRSWRLKPLVLSRDFTWLSTTG